MARRPGEDAIEVEISDTQGHLRADRDALVDLVGQVLVKEGRRRASISIAVVDQATIHALNRTHLGHDWPTDVLSFPLSDADDPVLAGELVVSAELAVATAVEFGGEPADELALYIVHGLLHLCGYDDCHEFDAGVMRRREDEILAGLGFSNPFDRVRQARTHREGEPGSEPERGGEPGVKQGDAARLGSFPALGKGGPGGVALGTGVAQALGRPGGAPPLSGSPLVQTPPGPPLSRGGNQLRSGPSTGGPARASGEALSEPSPPAGGSRPIREPWESSQWSG